MDDLGVRLQRALGNDYTVESLLGSGGFAAVYLVRDLRLKRNLAVKVLAPELVAAHSARERFRREAETIAQLSHPNIVPLHFAGHQDDLAYLVMAAIDGGTLADRLAREKTLPIPDVARIFAEVASALSHAHRRGVVHRDIKPQNVLIDAESGRALVTDFGIARSVDSTTLTTAGLVVGTPTYLSPEQVSGESSDHRADIYALGVMTYEMLAGAPPFTGATPAAVVMKRLTGPPRPLKEIRPDIPDLLVELVDACLVPNPEERLADAGDIVRALTGRSPVSGSRTTGTIPGLRRRRPRTWPLALGAVLALLAGAVSLTRLLTREETPRRADPVSAVDSGMVLIPAGEYVIGSDSGPAASRPAHRVPLAAFGIGRHEVTGGEFRVFMEATGVAADLVLPTNPRHPVTGVRLDEAARYCAWRHPGGGRLPNEVEWETAARGATLRRYAWGDTWDATAANAGAARAAIAPVGAHPRGRTSEGIEDMIGNVWEWTSSPFVPYGEAAPPGDGSFVIRGGAYNSYVEVATTFFRGRAQGAAVREHLSATGFRCAMTARVDGAGGARSPIPP